MSPKSPAEPKPKTKFTRSFKGGANLSTQRDAIEDDQLWWVEGAMPINDGDLQILDGPIVATFGDPGWHAAISGESGIPSYMCAFNAGGTDYIFAVWSNSGNGYIGDVFGFTVTKVFAGNLTSGTTSAAQWNNEGVLIIDPAGYWDWNVTTAATLTALSHSVQSFTITDGGVFTTFPPGATVTGGGGTGATASIWQGIGSAIPLATGSGYKVGDILTFRFTFGVSADGSEPQITVTTVNATGGVTGLKVSNPGQGINVGGACPATSALTGGAGTGASATLAWTLTEVSVLTRGSGYTTIPSLSFTAGGVTSRSPSVVVNTSGALGGTAIASYAGRAWIANGRTVIFTDAGAYSSFVGSGSEFTIDDSYLHDNITALYPANSYLYIFGVDNIDVLSNVTIDAAGDATFSRVNVSTSIGCDQANSIFSYYRAVCFANSTGFYTLAGASPEEISKNLALILPGIDLTAGSIFGAQGSPTTDGSAAPALLCAVWKIVFQDTLFSGGAPSSMLALYMRGKWFFCRQAIAGTPLTLGPIVSVPPLPGSRAFQFYTIDSTLHLYQLFSHSQRTYWRVCTKLYDCGAPMWTKQAIKAGLGALMGGGQATRAGLTLTVDTELNAPGAGPATTLAPGTFTGYKTFMGANSAGGGLFMGITATGVGATQADVVRLGWTAFQYQEVTEWAA